MTDSAPIDCDRKVACSVILVDLENVRIAWQELYRRVFEYEDLVYLVLKAEIQARASASKAMVFMTEPNSYSHSKRQKALEDSEKTKVKSEENAYMAKIVAQDQKSHARILSKLKEDEARTADLTDTGSDSRHRGDIVVPTDWKGPLGGNGINGTRKCKVVVKTHRLKRWKGSTVQRGCDVGLAAELTKSCFHPNIDNVILFSGDSDFTNILQDSLNPEDCGGILKFAKSVFVIGFAETFPPERLRQIRRNRFLQGISYTLIDEDYRELGDNFINNIVPRKVIPMGFFGEDTRRRNWPKFRVYFEVADDLIAKAIEGKDKAEDKIHDSGKRSREPKSTFHDPPRKKRTCKRRDDSPEQKEVPLSLIVLSDSEGEGSSGTGALHMENDDQSSASSCQASREVPVSDASSSVVIDVLDSDSESEEGAEKDRQDKNSSCHSSRENSTARNGRCASAGDTVDVSL